MKVIFVVVVLNVPFCLRTEWQMYHSGTMRSISCHACNLCSFHLSLWICKHFSFRLLLKWKTSNISSSPHQHVHITCRTIKHSRNISRVVSDAEISIELHGLIAGTELREREKKIQIKKSVSMVIAPTGIRLSMFSFLCGCNVREYCLLLTLLPNCRSAVLQLESG